MTIAAPLQTGLRIRELTSADAGAALARSRGWSYEPDRWRFMLATGDGWGVEDHLGGLVGTVLLTACAENVVAVGSMLVAAAVQRLGLGRALLEQALDAAGDRLVNLFATRPGRPLYERHGFRPVGELVMHGGRLGDVAEGDARGGAGGLAAGPLSRPATPSDLAAIAARDAVARGRDRTPLLRALTAFALAMVDNPASGAVRGYGTVWPSDGRVIVGPLVAVDGAAAVAVLDGLAADNAGPARVDVLAGDEPGRREVAAWLAERRFEAFGRTVMMVRGARDLPGRADLRYAPVTQSHT